MSQDIGLYRYNWDRLILDLRSLGIEDTYKLEKILLAFGEKCGNRYYLLNNEVWEEYNSFRNVIEVIEAHFNIESGKVGRAFINDRKYLDMCQSAWDVTEELNLQGDI